MTEATTTGDELDVDLVLLCAICEEPATCIGAYEGDEQEQPSCDECCGHGNEDGHCRPIAQADGHGAAR